MKKLVLGSTNTELLFGKFIKDILNRGHYAALEDIDTIFRFQINRQFSEIKRVKLKVVLENLIPRYAIEFWLARKRSYSVNEI